MSESRLEGYVLLDEIRSGGSATLYKAEDSSTGQIVALKRYHPAVDDKTFEREKRVLQNLDNPAFPDYIDDFTSKDEFGTNRVLVMEYVNGESLADMSEENHNFSSAELKDILIQGLDAINYLQTSRERPIIHRDIKPENIKITDEGKLRLLDFGIVTDEMSRTMGRTGFLGSYWYAAPEQFQGFAGTKSDTFAFGRVMYRLMAGKDYKDDKLDFKKLQKLNVHPNLVSAIEAMTKEDPEERAEISGIREILEKEVSLQPVVDENPLIKVNPYTLRAGIDPLFEFVKLTALFTLSWSAGSRYVEKKEMIQDKDFKPHKILSKRFFYSGDTTGTDLCMGLISAVPMISLAIVSPYTLIPFAVSQIGSYITNKANDARKELQKKKLTSK